MFIVCNIDLYIDSSFKRIILSRPLFGLTVDLSVQLPYCFCLQIKLIWHKIFDYFHKLYCAQILSFCTHRDHIFFGLTKRIIIQTEQVVKYIKSIAIMLLINL